MVSHMLAPLDPTLTLAMAVIASSTAPLLLLDDGLGVVAASRSFCQAFGIEPAIAPGRPLAELGGAWGGRQLAALLRATADGAAAVEAYEMDLSRDGHGTRRLVLNAQKLAYGEGDGRLLLAVTDVTDARAAERVKDDLLREKGVLLQELQHRVANSLQIIASVLLQSARRVQSDETRGHLHAAHQRVMSVAAVQKQLSLSSEGEVKLASYLTDLCRSLGASMIHDPAQITLEVNADASSASAEVSVSLGLIVTELVINALKHAFPHDRPGAITVGYHGGREEWTLCVRDDGVGMAQAPGTAKPGLGTSLVHALAQQLQAQVTVADANPGTAVSVFHTHADGNTEPAV